MNTKDRKAALLKTIDRIKTNNAYNAAAEIAHYRGLKAQAEQDMKTAMTRGNMKWYTMRRKAAIACDQMIREALKKMQGAKPALNKSGSPYLKTKDGGRIIKVR